MTTSAERMNLAIGCDPFDSERSLGNSKAIRRTPPRDCYRSTATDGSNRNFRIVVRFFNEQNAEFCHVRSRETSACERLTHWYKSTAGVNSAK